MTRKALFLLLPVVAFAFLASCAPKIVPVERVKIDSIFISQLHRDTVYKSDSVVIRTIADTVYKEAWRYMYRDRLVRDTVYKVQRDTVPRVVKVEKELSRMERVKLSLGEVFLWLLIAGAAVILAWFYKRLKGW